MWKTILINSVAFVLAIMTVLGAIILQTSIIAGIFWGLSNLTIWAFKLHYEFSFIQAFATIFLIVFIRNLIFGKKKGD